ncbi:hypothetical protein ACIGEZ_19820 [Streptomyces sp. NPDC085481]|uniref:hypothetical protein n=1 Tax=Streptomyces sp. NPDC085481 TaxID=3365727 RepID=UPI0037D80331
MGVEAGVATRGGALGLLLQELLDPVQELRVEVVAQRRSVSLEQRGERGAALQGFSQHHLTGRRRGMALGLDRLVQCPCVGGVGELRVSGEGLSEVMQQSIAAHE